jgi:bis(5'-nucleosyl)-tetraphosphatase (symmetrical)
MRTILIGDVHGCSEELAELLKAVSFDDKSDRLILLGDAINKGPDSLGVLHLIRDNKAECLMGNHELGFLNWLEANIPLGRSGFDRVKEQLGEELLTWVGWMKQLPLFIEGADFLAVHGGLVPGVALNEMSARMLTRIRTWDGKGEDINNPNNPAWYEFYHEKKLVVYGHWAARGLNVRANTIGLDSGCVWGGHLSALILPEKKIVQVKAKKTYAPADWE